MMYSKIICRKTMGPKFLAGVLAIGLLGCSTGKVSDVGKEGPITYKVGDGATNYASSTRSTMPSAPIGLTQQLDQASIDQDLYRHQRVGNTYTIMGKSYTPKHQPDYDETGVASWYGDKFHGKPTATGETYDMNDLTAAHKTLPLNSMLFITNSENGKSLMVRLNDRGPFVGDRIIDLSKASAEALGIKGLGKVRVQYAGPADPMAGNRAPLSAPNNSIAVPTGPIALLAPNLQHKDRKL